MSYNGWPNWATWIVFNWHGDSFADLALDAVLDGETDPNDLADAFYHAFYEIEEVDSILNVPGVVSDLLADALEGIDWLDLAETLYADAVNDLED